MAELKVRQSNLEMLRIVSMILIVMSHCDEIFGLSSLYSVSLGWGKILTDWLHIGGQIGVGCFVLISGYFMSEQIYQKKILKLASEVWFYTIGIWIVWIVCNVCQGEIIIKNCYTEAVYAFFPILFSHYWFVTAYVILMILSPFLNKLIYSLDEQYYRRFLGSLLVIFVVLKGGFPMVFPEMTEGRMMPVFIMYFIAGYIRKFGNTKNNSLRHFVVAIIFYLLLFATFYYITYLRITYNNLKIISSRYFYRELNSPFVVLICIELFMGFLKLEMKYNKVVNEIASCTFGVYLLHSNRLLSVYLTKLFPIYREKRLFLTFLYSILSVLLIYSISTLIDYIRKKIIGKIGMILKSYLDLVKNKLKKLRIKRYLDRVEQRYM